MDDKTMYWEDYDGQDIAGFTMLGVAGEDPQPITNFKLQLSEINRWRGDVLVRIYRPQQTKELVNV